MKIRNNIIILLFFFVLNAHELRAATNSVVAHMVFSDALQIVNVTPINFGTLLAGSAGTYVLSSSGAVTGTDQDAVLGGTTGAGSMTISGSSTQTISISTQNYQPDGGVTPSLATCSYDGGSEVPCALAGQAPPSSGKLLLVGVTVNVDGTQAIGAVAEPSFDVVVSYQ
ncbi:MAG: DUF4402 domain-containing protein [Proteobacteria bacterium]|jgi:hypothetical protein|nr:DUF4402 domain-containing protein [Alphaproteobacteria bacterium]NCC03320.1 DUF4402 domain-containing protein [Pseudomonadota bacterium]